MKGLRAALVFTPVFVSAGACCDTPPDGPSLDDITEWQHGRVSTAADAECRSDIEAEPNDTITQANLPVGKKVATCATTTLDGRVANDTDFFYLWGDPCDDEHPTATLVSGPSDARLCLFISCRFGKTGLDEKHPCLSGFPYRLDEGIEGCCTEGDGKTVEVNANCDSQANISITVPEDDAYVVVDRLDGGECGDYRVTVRL